MREILRRALLIAAGEGAAALTLGRLAADLDYTAGALYRYFPSKDALVAELQRCVVMYLDAAMRELGASITDAPGDPGSGDERRLAAVVAVGLGFADFADRSPAAFGFLSMYLSDAEYRLPKDRVGHVDDVARSALGTLAELLKAALVGNELASGNAVDRALTLWAAVQGVVQTKKLARGQPGIAPVGVLAAELVRALLIGWGAKPDAVDAASARVIRDGLDRLPGSVEHFLR